MTLPRSNFRVVGVLLGLGGLAAGYALGASGSGGAASGGGAAGGRAAGESMAPAASSVVVPPAPAIVAELERIYPQFRLSGLEDRTFAPETWWEQVLPIVEAAPGWTLEPIGQSAEGRPLRLLTWGSGPIPILLWSQMHGDESTASMALADWISFLAQAPDHPLAQSLASSVTLHLFPIVNPDGAARFQRRSAQGIDLNRDARALVTPEAQALKALQVRLEPMFGFNLHDQAVGTRVGRTDRGTAIALLAPPFNTAREVNPVRQRAMEVSSVIRAALEPRIGTYMARWDDTFNPRAFGDLMTAWGVSTILIESGGWEGDPEKQFLRELNFVALGAAFEAIATGAYAEYGVELYEDLPENGRRFGDLLIQGATVHAPGLPSFIGDVLVNFDHPLAERGARIAEIGDLAESEAREVVDARGQHLHVLLAGMGGGRGTGQAAQLAIGTPAALRLTRDPDGRDPIWTLSPEGGRDPGSDQGPARP
jgi:hypothetical protein